MSLNLHKVSHEVTEDIHFFCYNTREIMLFFFCHSRGSGGTLRLIRGDVNFAHLAKVMSVAFLHSKTYCFFH